jgi:hypothetical protein
MLPAAKKVIVQSGTRILPRRSDGIQGMARATQHGIRVAIKVAPKRTRCGAVRIDGQAATDTAADAKVSITN